jgi:hypothetical protein
LEVVDVEETNCQFCGEPLSDGDVCYRCHEHEVDQSYRKGYEEGFKKGLEEGRDEERSFVLHNLESDLAIPFEVKRRIRERV